MDGCEFGSYGAERWIVKIVEAIVLLWLLWEGFVVNDS